jgi:hypothetical protein
MFGLSQNASPSTVYGTVNQLAARLSQVELVAATAKEEAATAKEEAVTANKKATRLEKEAVLSTQDDAECGKRVLGTEVVRHALNIPPAEPAKILTQQHSAAYDQIFGKEKSEDDVVNKPLHALLSFFLPAGSCMFTGTSCPIKDNVGRIQKADLSCCDGSQLTAATVSAMLEGKPLLTKKGQQSTVVGQGVRRCKAINQLQAGQGREFSVVPFFDRTHVGFVKLDQALNVSFSAPEPMLKKEEGVWCALPGFQKLLRVCQDPEVSGFRRCPFPTATECEAKLDLESLVPLFVGRAGRRVFRSGDQVLKVQDEKRAAVEVAALRKLAGLEGVPTLVTKGSFKVTFPNNEELVGFLMSPFGAIPDWDTMEPRHGAFLANVITQAASREVFHGDVSPDNIIQLKQSLFLIDWGSSSSGGGFFQGCSMFCDMCCICVGSCAYDTTLSIHHRQVLVCLRAHLESQEKFTTNTNTNGTRRPGVSVLRLRNVGNQGPGKVDSDEAFWQTAERTQSVLRKRPFGAGV